MGSFEEIKMAVNPIIKLPQTKAMVFFCFFVFFEEGEKKERKGREKVGKGQLI